MDIGIGMNSHGLITREGKDCFVQALPAEEMRTLELCRLAERLGYHSLWFGDHVLMDRDTSAEHPANASGRRAPAHGAVPLRVPDPLPRPDDGARQRDPRNALGRRRRVSA